MSSAYWYEMAKGAALTKKVLEEKLQKYLRYLGVMQSLSGHIDNAIGSFSSASNSYSSGGFITDSGEILGVNLLGDVINTLSVDQGVVGQVISNLNIEIEKIKAKIAEVTASYYTFMANYQAAKAAEEAARRQQEG